MRDDFSGTTIDQLAKRVGSRCSNPECIRPTSGPRDQPEKSVNIGDAAHITAASPGGARYDANITKAARRSISNGIWLCQNCAKLIDNNPKRYNTSLLNHWKEVAEERARSELERPTLTAQRGPTLHIPASMQAAPWLSYVSQSTSFCGRAEELRLLQSFLQAERPFLWWIITGSAGSGKSRLSLELCKAAQGAWNVGFLSRAELFSEWSDWRPLRPTLVVVDYVAGRAGGVSDIALQLARVSAFLPAPVRMLLVERELTGSWWPIFMREGSHSESVDLTASQYALPIQLARMADDEIWSLTADVSKRFGLELTDADREEALAAAKHIDPHGRPLFAMIAVAAQLAGISQKTKDESIRSILSRETARWQSIILDVKARERALNLLVFATILGGFDVSSDTAATVGGTEVASLLPDPYFLDDERYAELAGGVTGESLLPGLQPDVVGEFFVLERLRGRFGTRISTERLLDTAWDHDPEAVSQFVRRAVADFPTDPAVRVLQEPVSRTADQRKAWSRLAADLVRLQNDSADPQGNRNLGALSELAFKHPSELELQENRAEAIFNLGCLFLREAKYGTSDQQFSLAIKLSVPGSDTQANALNNRGIARLYSRSQEEAFEDWSAVIAMTDASDEVRACAFNNRADISSADGDSERAIEDRSSVLELDETSYNRRYIAYIRRSREYLRLGRTDDAVADLAAIIATDDIVLEQKM